MSSLPRRTRRFSLPFAAIIAATTLTLASCGSHHARTPEHAPAPITREVMPRLDAFRASRLIITLPAQTREVSLPLDVTLDDGHKLPAAAYRVAVTYPASEAGAEGWLPPPGAWRTTQITRDRQGVGPVIIVVETPEDSQARTLHINGAAYTLNWLPSITLLPAPNQRASEPLLDPWKPVAEQPLLEDPSLLSRVRDESLSPLTRWRFRLLTDGLNAVSPHEDVIPFADPAIEAIARQNEDRWRVALAWTWAANPELAWRLKQRLASVVDFGASIYAPAWNADHTALDRLLSNLLDPDLSPQRRSELAEAWLADQPSGAAWIIDDGGLLDDSRQTIIAAIGFTNLTDHASRAWLDFADHPDSDFHPLLSLTTLKLLVPAPASTISQVVTTALTAHVGRWSTQLNVLSSRIPITPPGFSIGPLMRDFNMRRWTDSNPAAPDFLPAPDWTTAALLHRPPPDPAAPPVSSESRRWELLVEARMAPGFTDLASLEREAVHVYVGPASRPTAVLRIDLTGKVTNETPQSPLMPPELAPPPTNIEITRAADRWSFRLTLPPGAVEADDTIRLGIIRTDARGRRTSWPRPMHPWQHEPARAAFDTRAWSAGSGR